MTICRTTTTYACAACDWQPGPGRRSPDSQTEQHTRETGHPTVTRTAPVESGIGRPRPGRGGKVNAVLWVTCSECTRSIAPASLFPNGAHYGSCSLALPETYSGVPVQDGANLPVPVRVKDPRDFLDDLDEPLYDLIEKRPKPTAGTVQDGGAK